MTSDPVPAVPADAGRASRRLGSRRALATTILILVAADWLTKLWLVNRVSMGETRALLEGLLYVTHRRNTGVAFSLLADVPAPWSVVLISTFGTVAVLLFLRLIRTTSDRIAAAAMALIVAGATGNLGDRLVNGSVTDFILIRFFPYVFNFADAAITVGGIVLALRFLLHRDAPPAGTVSANS